MATTKGVYGEPVDMAVCPRFEGRKWRASVSVWWFTMCISMATRSSASFVQSLDGERQPRDIGTSSIGREPRFVPRLQLRSLPIHPFTYFRIPNSPTCNRNFLHPADSTEVARTPSTWTLLVPLTCGFPWPHPATSRLRRPEACHSCVPDVDHEGLAICFHLG